MWVAIAAAAISAAASIFGAARKSRIARRNARRQRAAMERKEAENEAWYKRRYNEDMLERSENRAALEQARRQLMRSSKAQAGSNAVTGATNAVAAAQKEANNETYSGLVAGIAQDASRKRDSIEQQYMQNKNAIADQRMQVEQAQAEAQNAGIDVAVAGVQGAASVAGAAMSGAGQYKATQKAPDMKPVASLTNQEMAAQRAAAMRNNPAIVGNNNMTGSQMQLRKSRWDVLMH